MSLFFTLDTLGLSFTKNLNWQCNISTLAKLASRKFGVPWRLRPFFSPSKFLALYRVLTLPCMEYGSHVRGGSTYTALLNRVESKVFRLINSPPLTDCLYSISHWCNVAYLSLFNGYVHADCSSDLGNYMPPPIVLLIPIKSIFLMQE